MENFDHSTTLSSWEIRAWRPENGIRTHYLCDTGSVTIIRRRRSEVCKWINEISYNYLNCGERYQLRLSIISSYLSPQFKYMIFHIFICKRHSILSFFFVEKLVKHFLNSEQKLTVKITTLEQLWCGLFRKTIWKTPGCSLITRLLSISKIQMVIVHCTRRVDRVM